MNSPQCWIAFLRLVVGFWFVKTVWTKLALFFAWGVIPYIGVSSRFIGFHPKRVAEFAAGNPLDWYRQFLEGTVLPNATLFAKLQAFGEALVGAALVLGLFTRLAAVVGLFLTLNYGLATQWMSFGQQGFHVMLVASMIIFIGAAAGRAWGIDQLILRSAVPLKRPWLKLFLSAALVVTVLSPRHSVDAAEWRVFVSSEKSNDVTVIGTEEKVLATIAVGQRPRGVTASHDGAKVYVANSDSNR